MTRLVKLLKDASHDSFEERALKQVTRFCHHCQLHSSAPRQFKFTLKDDHYFNYEILVDVMYLSSKPVLHVVDLPNRFLRRTIPQRYFSQGDMASPAHAMD